MSSPQKEPVEVGVPSEDPQKKDVDKRGSKEAEQKLSEEDQQIKEQVELLVTRAADSDAGLASVAVGQLADLLRNSGGGSVASVPKPLKYVRALYPELEQALKGPSKNAALTRRLHDVLSFISMTLEAEDGHRPALEHKLKGTQDDLGDWGHEYLRFLAGDISHEWQEATARGESTAHLSGFVDQITSYMVSHQDEPTCLDLLLEIDEVKRILPLVDEVNYKRIANYASAMSKYLTRPMDSEVLKTVYEVYTKMQDYPNAVITALQLGIPEKVAHLFESCTDKHKRLQMALTCARHKYFVEIENEEDDLLQDAIGNMRLSQLYRHCAQALDAMAPKTPEEVLKIGDSATDTSKDSRQNLTSTFVTGLVNCGYGKDKYLSEASTFLFDQKEDRVISTTAALGLLHLWDHTEGLQEIDKFFYSESNYIKSGACLASGIVMSGVKNPFDPALGLLSEHVNAPQKEVAIGAILGLGYAYAGTRKEDVKELLVPVLADGDQLLEVQCMAAYALAMVFVGSADEDVSETMMNCLLEIPEKKLTETCVRYMILALGCMFLGCQEAAETLLDATQALSPLISRYTSIVVRSCAFAATGNVVTIQNFFHTIAEADDDDDKSEDEQPPEDEADTAAGATAMSAPGAPTGSTAGNRTADALAGDTAAAGATAANEEEKTKEGEKSQPLNYKAAAVLGIGLVALGEELGTEMAKRAIIHALLADTVSKSKTSMSGRCAVPLVYAMLSASNTNMPVVETLNRLAHDSDVATATNAILAMGIVSAGSNNARVAGKLRNLAQYYQKEKWANTLFIVRLAQGLCAMGKGHLTISPLQNDRTTVCPAAVMGLLTLLHSALDLEKTILDRYHYMFFSIAPSISPRMVVAVNEEMEPIDGVQVRVGLPVDTVAVPGKPKSITGFQTQATPVLLSSTDKVELADAKYRSVPSIIEGVFVVEEKPASE